MEIRFSLFLVIPVFCYWTQEKDHHNKDGIETTQDFFPHNMHVTSMTAELITNQQHKPNLIPQYSIIS